MKTRNVLKALAAAIMLSSGAFAQVSITGTVKNTEGQAVLGASVFLKGENIGTTSDSKGNYTIEDVEKGVYTIKVRAFGNEELEDKIAVENQPIQKDFTLKTSFVLHEGVDVRAVRATDKTPTTYTNIDREEIEGDNFGQDLPFLLQSTPSTVVTSDAGAGVGYTGVRIRGVDPTRTNVTVNGIPLNDSESHGVFWVNMPDFASSVEDMQVQRGVGTSSNGGAAFGASINVNSNQINKEAYGKLDNSFGSFNTVRNTVSAGSGLLNNRFAMDARLSRITSDGYIDRASSNLRSFYLSGGWYGEKSSLKANVFAGHEVTYQAWYGTPESRIEGDEQEMLDYAARNGLSQEETDNLLNSGRTYNFYTYENEVDNYQQEHYQLLFNHQFNKKWRANVAGHYTRGKGYYEQFRESDDFSTYGYSPLTVEGDTVDQMDVIRRRWLDNHFYGGVFYTDYNNGKGLNITLGGGANAYDGDHYGEVIWAEFTPDNRIRDRYYDNNGFKVDAHGYLKGTYDWNKFTFFGDLQFRYIDYTFLGVDEVSGELADVTQNVQYNFFNPKGGFSYTLNKQNSLYASYAVANREPVRRDFRESTPENRPQHETLYNLEVGYRYKTTKGFFNANVYHMEYDNQLVLTGQINDVGGYTRTNVEESYRLGLEIEGGYKILKKLGVTGNLMVSQNKIDAFTEYVDNYDVGGQTEIQHSNTDLAFSPNFIASISLNYEPVKNLQVNLMNKYVGAQFLDNTQTDSRKLDAYFISHLTVSYTVKDVVFKEMTLGIRLNNLFNEMYENNGYTFGYIFGGERIQENFYYPQAGRNFLARLTIKL